MENGIKGLGVRGGGLLGGVGQAGRPGGRSSGGAVVPAAKSGAGRIGLRALGWVADLTGIQLDFNAPRGTYLDILV
ncbi:hypothetical protein [Telmatospirillum sp. J64-1]|uniref:hypothetical protein n=1 Tax=Telmatospirillum sp. J64-1 TaxID=2502183 RepID=UPI00115DB3F3|nr:hypothetical protein [Telmatospirillum sp. J64-1]